MNRYQTECDWFGYYRGDTSRDDVLFDPETVKHPAKMSLPLLRKILATMQEWGWLGVGSCVVDPFGGRGTTASVWCSIHPENRAVTIELEPHFVAMQHANREHAEKRLRRPLLWEILQGDSRKADELLHESAAGITSPPYPSGGHHHGIFNSWGGKLEGNSGNARDATKEGGYGHAEGQIGDLPDPSCAVTSPPYGRGTIGNSKADPEKMIARTPSLAGRNPNGAWFKALVEGYVNSPGNIDLLADPVTPMPYLGAGSAWFKARPGDIDNLPSAAVTSPPYATALGNSAAYRDTEKADADRTRDIILKNCTVDSYGRTEGNIGNVPDRDACAVTSPPYEGSLASGDPDEKGGLFRDPRRRNDRTLTSGYEASVTSPPYEDSVNSEDHGIDWTKVGPATGNRKRGKGTKHEETFRAQLSYQGAVTSPPYEAQSGGSGPASAKGLIGEQDVLTRHAASNTGSAYRAVTSPPFEGTDNASPSFGRRDPVQVKREQRAKGDAVREDRCGSTEGQIGATQSETYADAVAQVYAALARAGVRYLCVVTKNPTRAGKLRRLDKLTARLLRASGYRVVAWRRAWLYQSEAQLRARGVGQEGLFPEYDAPGKLRGRISFFKRIQLAKGGVSAQFEDVFFAELAVAP